MERIGAVAVALAMVAGVAVAGPVTAPIIGGTSTVAYPAVGALLAGDDPATAATECTVALVGCRTAVTAAHCLCPATGAACKGANTPAPTTAIVYFAHAGFTPIESIAIHPDFVFPVADVAVIRLASPVTGIVPLRLNDVGTPPFETTGTIVGFGVQSAAADDSGIKRVGSIVTAPCTADISNETSVCWDYAGPGANTCEGDSGGPLLLDLGDGVVLAGTTSGGFAPSCLPTDHSYDANLFVYRDWVANAAGGDLGTTECGGVATVGEPGAIATGFVGDLSTARPFAVESVGVAPGTTELRVGLNGAERPGRDFDLFVRAGAPSAAGAWDCSATGASQYGFCRIADPAPGSWYLRAERVSGDGFFQLVATTIGGASPTCGNDLREPGEDCDGVDIGTCTSGCASFCRCVECSTTDLDVREIELSPRVFVQARLGDPGGTYTELDPVTGGLSVDFIDAEHTVTISIPPDDPGWVVVNARRGRFIWRGDPPSPIRRIRMRKRSRRPGEWSILVAGRDLPGTESVDYRTLVVRVAVAGRCAERRFHVK